MPIESNFFKYTKLIEPTIFLKYILLLKSYILILLSFDFVLKLPDSEEKQLTRTSVYIR